jgi:hypothetical protein
MFSPTLRVGENRGVDFVITPCSPRSARQNKAFDFDVTRMQAPSARHARATSQRREYSLKKIHIRVFIRNNLLASL